MQEKERNEEMDYMVETLKMFGCGSWDATTTAGQNPTMTKWVGRAKKDEKGHEFVRCRLVAI